MRKSARLETESSEGEAIPSSSKKRKKRVCGKLLVIHECLLYVHMIKH